MKTLLFFLLSTTLLLSQTKIYTVEINCCDGQSTTVVTCETCNNGGSVTKFNGIENSPAFLINNSGGVISFYHGPDNTYLGNDIASSTDLVVNYGNGATVSYPNIVTSSSIDFASIGNYEYNLVGNTVSAGDIITVSFSWISDSGLKQKWTVDAEVPEPSGTSAYGFTYDMVVGTDQWDCGQVDATLITGRSAGLNTTGKINTAKINNGHESLVYGSFLLSVDASELFLGVNTLNIQTTSTSTITGRTLYCTFISEFLVECFTSIPLTCDNCDGVTNSVTKYNGIQNSPAFLINNSGGSISFYHGPDNTYTGNDIATNADLIVVYGNQDTVIHPNIVTSSLIDFTSISNYDYNVTGDAVAEDDIITIQIWWISDSGLLQKWMIEAEVPEDGGTTAYTLTHNIVVDTSDFVCAQLDATFIDGNLGGLNSINAVHSASVNDGHSAAVGGSFQYDVDASELVLNVNTFKILSTCNSSNPSGATLESSFISEFLVTCQ